MRTTIFVMALFLSLAGAAKESSKAEEKARESRTLFLRGDFSKLVTGEQCLPDPSGQVTALLMFERRSVPGRVDGLCPQEALVQSEEIGGEIPTGIVLKCKTSGQVVFVPYEHASAMKLHRVTFFDTGGKELEKLCGKAGCEKEQWEKLEIALIPSLHTAPPKAVELNREMLVVEFSAPADYDVDAVAVSLENTSVTLRRLPGPARVQGRTNVSFTVLDAETAKRNFGSRISSRYLVIDLQVKNPGVRKVQLTKSAVWFEVDFARAASNGEKKKELDIHAGPGEYKRLECGPYRYGLEHQYQHSPHDLLSILGTFDAIAGKKETAFQLGEMVVALASGLNATMIRGPSYKDATILLSGILLPRTKGIFLNEETEKRKRTQLLVQSFGNIVQIAPRSSVTTKVFLPRHVITQEFPEPVVVNQIRDVHLDLEVVTDLVDEQVVKGIVNVGMRMDQVLQALGAPDRTEKAADVTTWFYNEGRYEFVKFGKESAAVLVRERSVEAQLQAGKGKLTVAEVKNLLDLRFSPQRVLGLRDNGALWPVQPGVPLSLRFDERGVLKETEYKTAYERRKELIGQPEDKVLSLLEAMALDKETWKKTLKAPLPADASNKDKLKKRAYPSPDVREETLTVAFEEKDSAIVVASVEADPPR